MRRRFPAPLLLIVAACGGGSPTTTPPPGGTTPAVISIQAGDGQAAEPGATLSIKPVVAVKDAAGRGVGGVTVSFTIDSGGGSLQATSATTAADGTASPGDWHLGNSEGRNVMSASAASLATAKFVATATIASVTVATQTVGSGGATLAVNTGVLAGTRLVIPSGAFQVSATWTLEQRSNASWPRRTGVNPVGAVVHITSSDSGRAAQSMMLTLPAVVPAGTIPFVLIRDPVSNVIEVLQTVSYDAASITVAVQHFDASWIPSPHLSVTRPGLFGFLMTTGYDAEVVVSAMTAAELASDVDTGFRPGVDQWEFPMWETSFTPSPASDAGPIELGATITEMAYFASLKSQGGGALGQKYLELPEIVFSNRVGLRAAAFQSWVGKYSHLSATIQTIRNSMLAGQADQTFYNVLKAGLVVSHLPQFMMADLPGGAVPLTVYRVTGGKIDFANALQHGVSASVQFTGGHFAPLAVVKDEQGTQETASWIGTTPIGQWVKMSGVAQNIDALSKGSNGDGASNWPTAKVKARGGFVDDTILYLVDDTTRVWVECASCTQGMPSLLPNPAGKVEPFTAYSRNTNGSLSTMAGLGAEGYLINQASEADKRLGIVMVQTDGITARWLDFRWLRAKHWVVTIPTGLTADPGVSKSFSATVVGPALPPVRFVWKFGSGGTTTTVNTTTSNVTTTLSGAGDVPVTLQVRRTPDDSVIAVGHGTVTMTSPLLAWKFTSASVAFGLSQPPVVELGSYDSRWRADSEIVGRIASGITKGGIRIVDQAFSPPGLPSRTAPVGLYLLEGQSITLANLLDQATADAFIVTSFASASTTIPTAPQVSGWNLLQQAGPVNPLCHINEDFYSFSGTVTAGHLLGLRVPLCFQRPDVPWVDGQRLMALDADVTFTDATASGTINMTWYFYGNFNPGTYLQRTARLTFTATRVVN